MLPLVLAAALLCGAWPSAAWAHAELVRTRPADGAILPRAPAEVRVIFDDAVRPASGIEAVRNTGGSVLRGGPRTAPGDERVLVIPLRRTLPAGDYSVRWRIISDEGHPIEGVLAFRALRGPAPARGAAAPPPSRAGAAPQGPEARQGTEAPAVPGRPAAPPSRDAPRPVFAASDNAPPTADVIARWLLLLGLLSAAGALAFRVLVWHPVLRRAPLPERERARLDARERRLTALLLGTGLYLATFGASLALVHLPESVPTRFGRVATIGLAAAALGVVGASFAAAASGVASRVLLGLLAVPTAAVVLVPSLGGHALDPDQPLALSLPADLVHVFSVSVWFGGLLELALVAPFAARAVEPTRRGPLYAALAVRFSALALVSVLLIMASGLARALTMVGGPEQLWATSYGRVLLVKAALFGVLTALGALNVSRLVPRLVATATEAPTGLRSFARLRRNLVAEIAVVLAVAAAVALLTDLPPARDRDARAAPAVWLVAQRPRLPTDLS